MKRDAKKPVIVKAGAGLSIQRKVTGCRLIAGSVAHPRHKFVISRTMLAEEMRLWR